MARHLLATFVALLSTLAPVWAQDRNPVLEHFRAYRAALEAGDLQTAEAAAAEALAASVARDGDGGRTAVLALNLAIVRLSLSNYEGARAPASQALRIANELGAAANVDPLMVELALGRAELGSWGQESGVTRLLAALPRVSADDAGIVADGHAAAFDLAAYLFQEERYAEARMAWAEAVRLAAGSPMGVEYARGRAQTFEAASLFLQAISDRSRRLRMQEALEIDGRFRNALMTLMPLARQLGEGGAMTLSQQAYAEALVWRSVLRAQMGGSAGDRLDRQTAEQSDEGDAGAVEYGAQQIDSGRGDLSLPICAVRLMPRPMPRYPSGALDDFNVGALVVRLQFNEAGELVDRSIAASVGGDVFVRSVEAVLPRWEIRIESTQPPACRMPAAQMTVVRFSIH